MAVKVYVGNLSESVTPKDLQQLFENFGVIEEVAILGKYAFVHFQRNEDANDSIKALNNTEFMGTIIRVEVPYILITCIVKNNFFPYRTSSITFCQ
jgi:RNA recognition motif-containing protein